MRKSSAKPRHARYRLLWLWLACGAVAPAAAATLETHRQQYTEASEALRAGKLDAYRKLADGLKDYPLYPYLVYEELRPRTHKVSAGVVKEFLAAYPDFIAGERLRSVWLKQLARRKEWRTFLENYTPQRELALRCQQLQARIATGGDAALLEDTQALWLDGDSLPSQCDGAFERLYASALMSSELAWRRIGLAMEEGNTGLANYLGKFLDQSDALWLRRWLLIHRSPAEKTAQADFPDAAKAREILVYGIKRLARRSVDAAVANWNFLQGHYGFTPEERHMAELAIALNAARKKHPDTATLLDQLPPSPDNEELFHWRLQTALRNGDWARLYDWTQGPPPQNDAIKYRWIYWRGRALERLGRSEEARPVYASIAGERDYYGFLAADRLGFKYRMNHHAASADADAKNEVEQLPGIRRAGELFVLYGDYRARAEWQYTVDAMSAQQKEIAAQIAADWGWHDRAIFTLASARAFDNLILRFPLLYRDVIEKYAARRDLDLSWVFALTRAESAFMEKVSSPAGALGLMQIMPATGRLVSRTIGLKNFRSADLLDAERNVLIGTAYMQQMRDKFNGNHVIATASYNAGPSNTSRWLPKKDCVDADVWIELIPFRETRKYVKRVLFYASVYDWRLQRPPLPLKDRMAAILPRHPAVAADETTLVCDKDAAVYDPAGTAKFVQR